MDHVLYVVVRKLFDLFFYKLIIYNSKWNLLKLEIKQEINFYTN